MTDTTDLLIIGAGPVGLTAAVEAKRLGLSARIIGCKDKWSTHDSRALIVHPRVLELLEPDGDVVSKIQDSSFRNHKVNFHFDANDVVLEASLGKKLSLCASLAAAKGLSWRAAGVSLLRFLRILLLTSQMTPDGAIWIIPLFHSFLSTKLNAF